jgi:hypothetical protein
MPCIPQPGGPDQKLDWAVGIEHKACKILPLHFNDAEAESYGRLASFQMAKSRFVNPNLFGNLTYCFSRLKSTTFPSRTNIVLDKLFPPYNFSNIYSQWIALRNINNI